MYVTADNLLILHDNSNSTVTEWSQFGHIIFLTFNLKPANILICRGFNMVTSPSTPI